MAMILVEPAEILVFCGVVGVVVIGVVVVVVVVVLVVVVVW